jgi:hypothetical protein
MEISRIYLIIDCVTSVNICIRLIDLTGELLKMSPIHCENSNRYHCFYIKNSISLTWQKIFFSRIYLIIDCVTSVNICIRWTLETAACCIRNISVCIRHVWRVLFKLEHANLSTKYDWNTLCRRHIKRVIPLTRTLPLTLTVMTIWMHVIHGKPC